MYDGGPAFPHDHPAWAVCPRCNTHCDRSGMSLRDYFAGQALAGLTATTADDDWECGSLTKHTSRNLAIAAVKLADDMLAALKGGAES